MRRQQHTATSRRWHPRDTRRLSSPLAMCATHIVFIYRIQSPFAMHAIVTS